MEEQEAIIKTLNKQLTHCEADLQAHMELVSGLETSLSDSEKNREFWSSTAHAPLTFVSSPQSPHAGYRTCSRARQPQ
jgi:hypothetical protein